MRRPADLLRDPRARFRFAAVLFAACFLAQFTALFLPQGILNRVTNFISWSALWLTALDVLATTDVRREVDSR